MLALAALALSGCRELSSTEPAIHTPHIMTREEAEAAGVFAEERYTGSFAVSVPQAACYSRPSDEAETILGFWPKGTVLDRIREEGPYLYVKCGEVKAWVCAWDVTAVDPLLQAKRNDERLRLLTDGRDYASFDTPVEMCCPSQALACRENADPGAMVLALLPAGTVVTVYGRVGDAALARHGQGNLFFCDWSLLSESVMIAVLDGAVDLRALLPEARFELLFTSARNITGHPLYPAVPLLESTTASRLKDAYEVFLRDGYALKIYDAYRPRSAQIELFDAVRDPRYIADPNTGGSWHQAGRAVDISLVERESGQELEMPTPMHTFSRSASRSSAGEWTETAAANVRYMTEVMRAAGFSEISTEWWHFEYLGPGGRMDPELDYASLQYRSEGR